MCDPELDRRHRAVAWQILHGALSVGVFAAHIGRHASLEQCQCPYSACMGAAQTLSHLFLECEHARPVVLWVARVWAAVTGGSVRAITAAVLLAADDRGWPVADALRPLWLRLRLATLWQLWSAASRCRLSGEAAPTAAMLAARVVHDCRGAMRRDWVRVREDLALGAGVPRNWLRGRTETLSVAEFQARWCQPSRHPLPRGAARCQPDAPLEHLRAGAGGAGRRGRWLSTGWRAGGCRPPSGMGRGCGVVFSEECMLHV